MPLGETLNTASCALAHPAKDFAAAYGVAVHHEPLHTHAGVHQPEHLCTRETVNAKMPGDLVRPHGARVPNRILIKRCGEKASGQRGSSAGYATTRPSTQQCERVREWIIPRPQQPDPPQRHLLWPRSWQLPVCLLPLCHTTCFTQKMCEKKLSRKRFKASIHCL